MKTMLSKAIIAASLALAATFTLNCSSDDGNDSKNSETSSSSESDEGSSSSGAGGSSSSIGNGSSSSGGSSSSVEGSSSSSLYVEACTFQDTRNDKTYKCVTIGDKTWMAENLNFNWNSSSFVWSKSSCYDDNQENCDKYGRLYNDTPVPGCETQCLGGQLEFCPADWHTPTNEEWQELADLAANGNMEMLEFLSGGYFLNDEYTGIDEIGSWLTHTNLEDGVYTWRMTGSGLENVKQPYSSKHSIRCVRDRAISVPPVTYQGETYPAVVIGNQTWLAKNLNYDVEGSKCYDNDLANCAIYGRLYNWAQAMNLPSSCSNIGCGEDRSCYISCSELISTPHQGICPIGWHIPTYNEWILLLSFAGNGSVAENNLKATNGWIDDSNGTDEFGFAALPGGSIGADGDFHSIGEYGNWWSATERDSTFAWNRGMLYYYTPTNYSLVPNFKVVSSSVRCIKD